jgi:hypothetical protein
VNLANFNSPGLVMMILVLLVPAGFRVRIFCRSWLVKLFRDFWCVFSSVPLFRPVEFYVLISTLYQFVDLLEKGGEVRSFFHGSLHLAGITWKYCSGYCNLIVTGRAVVVNKS